MRQWVSDTGNEAVRRRGLACFLVVMALLAFPGTAPARDRPAGSVVSVEGRAEALSRGVQRPLSANSELFRGDTVRTAERSRLSLLLGRDIAIRLSANASLAVDDFVAGQGGGITLDSGSLLIDKDPAGSDNGLTVKSEFGLIAVRGTRFFVGRSNGRFSVFLIRGRLSVAGGGQTVTLEPGEGTDFARPGARPSPVREWSKARIRAALALFE